MAGWCRLSEDGQLIPVDDTTGEETCSFRSVPFFVDVGVDKIPVILFALRKFVDAVFDMLIKGFDPGLLSPLAGLFR